MKKPKHPGEEPKKFYTEKILLKHIRGRGVSMDEIPELTEVIEFCSEYGYNYGFDCFYCKKIENQNYEQEYSKYLILKEDYEKKKVEYDGFRKQQREIRKQIEKQKLEESEYKLFEKLKKKYENT